VWAGIVCDWLVDLQTTTTETFSYIICQRYWKMYHWQSEHECCIFMMVLQHISVVMSEVFLITHIMTDW
jgi:hypothetical protein